MRHLLFVFLGLFSWGLLAQECDCASTFAWVKTTFTINDAGYAYAVEQKGEKALAGVTADVERRVATVTDRSACQQIIEEWLRFFRNGHLNIRSLGNSTSSGEPASEAVIQVSFADWERRPLTEVAFKKYLDGKEEPGYEGIWTSGAYAIAVKREGEDYVGSILRADGVYWQQDQVKLKISPAGEGMAASYYMRDHSEERFTDVSLLGNNQLEMGFINLKRTYPVREELPEVAEYYRAMSARKPYFVQLDERTTMLRIPSFSGSEKPVIDSVINANRDRITSTENQYAPMIST
ncbi:MAG: peptidase S41, partial [Bacteroidota bacterium]